MDKEEVVENLKEQINEEFHKINTSILVLNSHVILMKMQGEKSEAEVETLKKGEEKLLELSEKVDALDKKLLELFDFIEEREMR